MLSSPRGSKTLLCLVSEGFLGLLALEMNSRGGRNCPGRQKWRSFIDTGVNGRREYHLISFYILHLNNWPCCWFTGQMCCCTLLDEATPFS